MPRGGPTGGPASSVRFGGEVPVVREQRSQGQRVQLVVGAAQDESVEANLEVLHVE